MTFKTCSILCGIALIVAILVGGTAAWGQENIKQRMQQRLPVINALKAKGIIGENNQGFLEFRGGREKADVVNAENADRALVYEAIAKNQGTTADLVGRRRAIQLRELALPGEWLQNESGGWYQK